MCAAIAGARSASMDPLGRRWSIAGRNATAGATWWRTSPWPASTATSTGRSRLIVAGEHSGMGTTPRLRSRAPDTLEPSYGSVPDAHAFDAPLFSFDQIDRICENWRRRLPGQERAR